MNILIINHYAGSPALGMELRPYYFGRELIKKGHSVTIIASSFSHYRARQPDTNNHYNNEIIDGINYIWIKTPEYKKNNLKRFYNIMVFILKLFYFRKRISNGSQFDAVISSSTYPLDIFPSLWFAKKNRAKLIYEVHDLWPLSPIVLGGMSKWNPFIILMQFSENFAYRKCDHIVSLLENAKAYMTEHGLDSSKFNYLPNGVNPDEWTNGATINNQLYQVDLIKKIKDKYKTIIGYTGAFGPANSMRTFIEAANILKNDSYGFVIMGKGQEKEYLINLSDSMRLDNVLFLEPVKKEHLHSILSLFNILYIGYKNSELYKHGVCPNKLFDYIMAVKPVIFGLGHPYSVIENTESVYQTEPGNSLQLAEKIKEISVTDAHTRKSSAIKSRDYVVKNHSFEVLTENLLRIINERD